MDTVPTSPVRAEASLYLTEWEKLSLSFAAEIRHRSLCKLDTVATDSERACLWAKGRQMDSLYLPESSIRLDEFSYLCV